MRDRYEPELFEAKWRERWLAIDLYKTREEAGRENFYGLEFFPYPSGAGLSVGHARNYIPTDVLCRMKYMQGYNVLHPMGFDAFGLPAENEAIKRKRHPAKMIEEYGARYRQQMELIGIGYDWSRSFSSSDPSYYKWTQWIFKLLYERGLAYRKNAEVNWCPKDKTALANEEVVAGNCERCGTPVEKRAIPQWFFKITDYAQRLLDDLDDIDWPEGIKLMQRNWIGRSEGVEFRLKVADYASGTDPDASFGMQFGADSKPLEFTVFTTRIDTIFGMTFCVLAPEHPLVAKLKSVASEEIRSQVEAYQAQAKALSDMDRQAVGREKSGVFTGSYAINPANGKRVPIYIADYVLMGYGTGAIMAVPAHDQRDFDFAMAFGLDVIPVIQPDAEYWASVRANLDETDAVLNERYLADPKSFRTVFAGKSGTLIQSGEFTGLDSSIAIQRMGEWVESSEIGTRKVNYKLRDWLISRQRYWGCPIPVVYDKEGHLELVPDSQLPVLLPEVESYEPSDDGSSPLSRIPEFVHTTSSDGTLGYRETDTMGGFACSSWYFLRFCDPHNDQEPWNLDALKKWMPVDCYVGGAEHAVMHLLYARFWTKVLYDAGLVPVKEPFQKLRNQGQVLGLTPYRQARAGETLGVGEDGILVSLDEAKTMNPDDLDWRWVRMSKSKGNVVTPEEAVESFGADALRLYELFVAPFEQAVQWSNEGMQGQVRFLSRVMKFASEVAPMFDQDWPVTLMGGEPTGRTKEIRRVTHQLILKATEDIEKFAFNTYVAAMMTALNSYTDLMRAIPNPDDQERAALSEALRSLVLILAPAAPHTADEVWEGLGIMGFTYNEEWPKGDLELAKADVITVALQVNGKLRGTVDLPASATQEELEAAARGNERVLAYTEGLTIRKVIVVPGKLVNIVAN